MTRKHSIFIVMSVLVLTGLACNLGKTAGKNPTQMPAPAEANTQAPAPVEANTQLPAPVEEQVTATSVVSLPTEVAPTPTLVPTDTPEPTATPLPTPTQTPAPTSISSNPIGLWQGLSSLNSYRLKIRVVNNGPTAQDINQNAIFIASGSDGNSSHIHTETTSSSADAPEVNSGTSDQYRVGNHSCSFSSGSNEVTKEDLDPMVNEMTGSFFKLIDLVPVVNDPVFVGQEELNGVKTNHFNFTVSGLGVDSGAEVVASGGEYWLAQDGQYIVKYSLVLETRNGPAGDPNTRTMDAEFYIEVQDINQDIVITFPDNCQ
jgi:hypothetical protein